MSRARFALPGILMVLTALLAGCQTTTPAATAPAPAAATGPAIDSGGRIWRQGKGWTVAVQGEDKADTATRQCLGSRLGARSANIAFAVTRDQAWLLLRDAAGGVRVGETVALTAVFDDSQQIQLDATALADGTLAVPFPIASYEDSLLPFARGRRVVFRAPVLDPRAKPPIALVGSSWVLNALDECRRMHVAS